MDKNNINNNYSKGIINCGIYTLCGVAATIFLFVYSIFIDSISRISSQLFITIVLISLVVVSIIGLVCFINLVINKNLSVIFYILKTKK